LGGPFRALVRELVAVRAWQPLALRAAATLLVLEAARVLGPDGDSRAPLARPTSPAVVRARRLLDERYGERWRVADLAAGSGISATHLAELFTRDVGVPPHRYLLERRIERAAELLAGTDLPVTAVALEVGFGSGQHLARAFRSATGCTPRDYRRTHQR
jgi:AraC-like DNA-binding protein